MSEQSTTVTGGYVILFALSIVVLRRRKTRKQGKNRLHLISLTVLFFLATLVILLHSAQNLRVIALNLLDYPLEDISDQIVIGVV